MEPGMPEQGKEGQYPVLKTSDKHFQWNLLEKSVLLLRLVLKGFGIN